jgi:RHS repeat-associated protein
MADERGSIVSVTNAAGAILAINSYDEYGIPGTGNIGRFQYTGQVWLPEVGLYHYKARMYSPTLGRFMQTDPIGYADGMNWYAYVGNDPINSVDPLGLQAGGGSDLEVTAPSYCSRFWWEARCNPYAPDRRDWQWADLRDIGMAELSRNPLRQMPGIGGGHAIPPASGSRQTRTCFNRGSALHRAYMRAHRRAFDRFFARGGEHEEAYSVFRNDVTGDLRTFWESGSSIRTQVTMRRPGYALLFSGHIHPGTVGPNGFLGLGGWQHAGPSDDDIASRSYFPNAIFVLHERVEAGWRARCF